MNYELVMIKRQETRDKRQKPKTDNHQQTTKTNNFSPSHGNNSVAFL